MTTKKEQRGNLDNEEKEPFKAIDKLDGDGK